MTGQLTRRGFLAAGAATLAGCVAQRQSAPSARSSAKPVQPPPAAPPYVAPGGDPLPAMKTAAGLFVQALATFGPAAASSPPPGYVGSPADLDRAARPLAAPGQWSRGIIDFVQLGGLTPVSKRASSGVCMVVLRQELQAPGGPASTVSRTLDVRLRRAGTAWEIEQLAAIGNAVTADTRASAVGRRLLDNLRITMPDTARWDIASGSVSNDLLVVLTRLAQVTPLSLTVLKTGHPRLVVDGRRRPPVSSHFYGRAADIFALDGVPIAQVPAVELRRLLAAAIGLPTVRQVGAPVGYDTDGRGRRVFSNLVHADHLHVAVGGAGSGEGAR